MRIDIAELMKGLIGILPVAALISYGYTLIVRTVHEIRFYRIASAYARNTAGSWIHAVAQSISRESFWHGLFSATIVRSIPHSRVSTTVAFRSLLSALEILTLLLLIRTVPLYPVYVLFGASFIFRLFHHDGRQVHGTILFGAALFLFPLLHPVFFDIPLLKESLPLTVALGTLLFLAGRKQVCTTALLSLLILLEQTHKIPPAAVPALSLTIFAGSNAALHAWMRKVNRRARRLPRILLLETVILAALTLVAGTILPAGGSVTAAAVLCMSAVAEFVILHGMQRKSQPHRTEIADPLSLMEMDEYQICTKSEYTVTLVQLILGCTSDTFSQLRTMVRDIQNASTLIHETRAIRTAITREEAAISVVVERTGKAAHILINHHRNHELELMMDTVLHISRYTGRIAGKIVNLAEYFDRLRKKKAFFSDEESMEVTELLAMTNDIAGYVSDYLAGMVHSMDTSVLSGMEKQLRSDSELFRKEALIRLERSHAGEIRTNLVFIETIETIRSIRHYLDRISILVGKIDPRYA